MAAVAIKAYFDPDLARLVTRLATAQGRSESAIITEAVRLRMAASAESVILAEEESVKRQLSRIENRLDKIVWDGAQLKEMVLLFVRVWFEYNPQLDPEHEESAASSAEARFERFLDIISNGLSAGRSMGDLDARVGVDAGAGEHEMEAEMPA
jgi:predicted transcriptional regulator